jgi:hypothetical protein
MQTSGLENQIKKSRFSRICDEFRQWKEPENRDYFDHCLLNALKILFGYEPVDYKLISHENKVASSFIFGIDKSSENKISQGNRVVASRIYNSRIGRFE